MTERRFSQDEAKRVFELASESDDVGGAEPGTGLTLTELQSIGAEVGLDTEAIRKAALALDHIRPAGMTRHWGLPASVSRSVPLGRVVDDEEWEQLVIRSRRIFEARGSTDEVGGIREWWNGNLHVTLEPGADGDVLHMSTKNDAVESTMVGAIMLAFGVVLLVAMFLLGDITQNLGKIIGPGLIGGFGLAALAYQAVRLPRWARDREAQFEVLGRSMLKAGTSETAAE